MGIAVGTDIIKTERIKSAYEKFGTSFLDKIFTKSEQAYCDSKADKFASYAARFAAKEAFTKACRCGICHTLSWLDVSVENNLQGSPDLILSDGANKILKSLNFTEAKVSMSHTDDLATAVVILT